MRPSTLFAFIALITAPIALASDAPYNELNARHNREDVAQLRARHYAKTILDVLERRARLNPSTLKTKAFTFAQHRAATKAMAEVLMKKVQAY